MRSKKLVLSLVSRQLTDEVENILCVVKQGFDLQVLTEFPEVSNALIELLNLELEGYPELFSLLTDLSQIKKINDPNVNSQFRPIVLINNKKLENGCGFVRYNLKSPDKLIKNPGSAVKLILDEFGLSNYIDTFNGKIFTKLKEISRIYGVHTLIDAVIQTAYLAGMQGDESAAEYYLNQIHLDNHCDHNNSDHSINTCAKRFLSHCVAYGDNSMAFLKSSLCFYVAENQKRTMTQTSQILNISRTTLNEHLKKAEILNVGHFFTS